MTSLRMIRAIPHSSRIARFRSWPLLVSAMLILGGCASEYATAYRERVSPPERTLPPTRVFFYPTTGQSEAQQDRDRYECHLWAVKQSGFDPSLPLPAPAPRVEVIASPPPGQDTAAGVVTGAVLGAAVSSPRHAGENALLGAVVGGLIGAASDASRQERVEAVEQRYASRRDTRVAARLDRLAQEYRRAMSACLEGRGYSVQ